MNTVISLQKKLSEVGLQDREVSLEVVEDTLIISDLSLPEFKIYVIVEEDVMKCWIPIASVNEFSEAQRTKLNETLLHSNGMLPLSNFGISGNMYCLAGDLSSTSTFENIVLELNTLFNNVVEVIEGIFVPAKQEQ